MEAPQPNQSTNEREAQVYHTIARCELGMHPSSPDVAWRMEDVKEGSLSCLRNSTLSMSVVCVGCFAAVVVMLLLHQAVCYFPPNQFFWRVKPFRAPEMGVSLPSMGDFPLAPFTPTRNMAS